MAVSPIGGMVYANQSLPMAASKQMDFQTRMEAQNLAAGVAANEKDKEVQAVRPTEETHKIDPEREHEQKKKDQEAGADESQVFRKKHEEDEEDLPPPPRLLDITI
ncbi:hypothetical protein JWV37_06580 [Sulfurospirillum sp. T05]|uniref:Uncharacterized protein n=1 Tax=Sulfurospirillum tamanense TaxID=2813362 RepID=A0ABS2WS55_9BACT|nr:hypothetical protein [Sulfurospirillum tamanensis]MBN2964438.1 hypothetical protein [Sulfurospirillum tamanensis]